MSLSKVKKELKSFLSNEQPEAICIKGKWGIGKTYLWNEIFKEAFIAKEIKLDFYSYVSLFGVNTLNEIKLAIFENTLNKKDFLIKPNALSFQKLMTGMFNSSSQTRPLIRVIEKLTKRDGLTDSLSQIGFVNIRKQIICFDDFERAGKGLSPTDLLGISSLLKEKQDCKIVFIVNDSELTPDKSQDFYKHIEKICEKIISIEISPTEACSIVLDKSSHYHDCIRDHCDMLNITNIRTINKINILCNQAISILEDLNERIVKQCIASIALGVCSYLHASEYPTLEFIRSYHGLDWYVQEIQNEIKTNEKLSGWVKMLDKYGYTSSDVMDFEIFDSIVRGYFLEDALVEKAKIIEKETKYQSRDNSLSRAWDELYHGSLDLDDDVILNGIYQATVDNISDISPNSLNSSVVLLRANDETEKADNLISIFTDNHKEEDLNFWNIDETFITSSTQVDPFLLEAMQNQFENHNDIRPLEIVIENAVKDSLSNSDYRRLSKIKPADFEKIILNLKGSHLKNFLDTITSLHMKGDENAQLAYMNAKEALIMIAKSSPLRARRIARYGIYID